MRNLSANLTLALGSVYVLVGLVGFARTGLSGFAASQGSSLLFVEINPLHNFVQVVVGAGLIAGAMAGRRGLKVVAGSVAAVYGWSVWSVSSSSAPRPVSWH